MRMAIPKIRYSLKKAIDNLKNCDAKEVKKELADYFGTNNRWGLSRRINRLYNVPYHVYNDVENIFAKFGVNKGDVLEIIEDD